MKIAGNIRIMDNLGTMETKKTYTTTLMKVEKYLYELQEQQELWELQELWKLWELWELYELWELQEVWELWEMGKNENGLKEPKNSTNLAP